MTMTTTTPAGASRIRWYDAPSVDPAAFLGYIGTGEEVAFRIYNHEPLRNEWVLTSDLPGTQRYRRYAEGLGAPEELKQAAETWLTEFVTSLGAVFPGDASTPVEAEIAPAEAYAFPLDVALGSTGSDWCVLAEDGERADCATGTKARCVAAEIAGTGRRAAIYVRSPSRHCFARYETIEPAAVTAGGEEDR